MCPASEAAVSGDSDKNAWGGVGKERRKKKGVIRSP